MRDDFEPGSGVTYIGPRAFVAGLIGICAVVGAAVYAAPSVIGALEPVTPASDVGVVAPTIGISPRTVLPQEAVAALPAASNLAGPVARATSAAPALPESHPQSTETPVESEPANAPNDSTANQPVRALPTAQPTMPASPVHARTAVAPHPARATPPARTVNAAHTFVPASAPHSTMRPTPASALAASLPTVPSIVRISRDRRSHQAARLHPSKSEASAALHTALLVPLKPSATVPPTTTLQPHSASAPIIVAPSSQIR